MQNPPAGAAFLADAFVNAKTMAALQEAGKLALPMGGRHSTSNVLLSLWEGGAVLGPTNLRVVRRITTSVLHLMLNKVIRRVDRSATSYMSNSLFPMGTDFVRCDDKGPYFGRNIPWRGLFSARRAFELVCDLAHELVIITSKCRQGGFRGT